MSSMEPIPETVEAVNDLDPARGGDILLSDLVGLANQAQRLVPDLVGVSIAPLENGLTFTLVATSAGVAVLDAIQYAAGGPCVDAARLERVMGFEHDVLDEERWRLFAEATAARAVRSTLTLPVVSRGRVVATVNLYAASAQAFAGQHDPLAAIFGAWAAGAVANADLSFSTRLESERAPQRLRDQTAIDVATGILAAQLRVDVDTALERLTSAASRAGVSLVQLAHDIVATSQGQDDTVE